MPLDSNIDELGGRLADIIRTTGFEMELTEGKTLGEFCVDVIVGAIQVRADYQQGADGRWPDNDPVYLDRKEREFGETRVNFRTNQMLSDASLRGKTTITNHVVTMEYGTGKPADTSPTGYLSDDDRSKTDVEKAYWANQQDRRFYDIGEDVAQKIHIIAAVATTRHIQNKADHS